MQAVINLLEKKIKDVLKIGGKYIYLMLTQK